MNQPCIPMWQRWAQFRFSVIGELLSCPPEKGQLQRAIDPNQRICFGASTIERWYYKAKAAQDPISALGRKIRADAGSRWSVSEPVLAARPAELKPDDSYDSEVVEINSELATAIEMKHRTLGNDTLAVCREVLGEIAANVAEEVAGSFDGNDKPVLRSMSPAARAKALKDLTIAMDKAVNIERKSWDLDAKEGAGGKGAVFNVLINVPDPKPLPEDF